VGPWQVSSSNGTVARRPCVGGAQQQPTSVGLRRRTHRGLSPISSLTVLFLLCMPSLLLLFLLRRGSTTRGGGLRHTRWWSVAWHIVRWWPAPWLGSDPGAAPRRELLHGIVNYSDGNSNSTTAGVDMAQLSGPDRHSLTFFLKMDLSYRSG
jgi:hypothetical protein